MAALTSRFALASLGCAVALAGCGELHGLRSEDVTPLARIQVRVVGDIEAVRRPEEQPPRLRVALVWGQPWLPDASCIPPFENQQHADVAATGCGDPLGFRRAGFGFGLGLDADAAVAPDGTATLDQYELPSTLYGDMYSQIVYGSVVVYDDINGSQYMDDFDDVVYGASFRSMSEPDTRVAFRHGAFDDRSAYYPRRGCPPPAEGFSIVSTGGFTLQQAVEAQLRGELPQQDPALCSQDPLDREIAVELRNPDELDELTCLAFATGYYTPPPPMPPHDAQLTACTSIPDRGTGLSHGKSQLLIASAFAFTPRDRTCRFLQHVLLRGCFDDPFCATPEWDVPRPPWWPCRVETAQ